MIITLNIDSESTYYKIYNIVNGAFAKLGISEPKTKGRPKKYSNQQIVACMLYGKNRYIRHIKRVLFSYLIDEFIKRQQGIKSRKYL